MSAQHTPGPWRVGGKYAYKTVLLNVAGESIASGGNNRAVQGPELEASLILAAAAPELLAALRAFLGKHDDRDGISDLWPKEAAAARAAIAKATGGQS